MGLHDDAHHSLRTGNSRTNSDFVMLVNARCVVSFVK